MENIRITVLSVLFLSAAVYLADMLISGTGMEKTVRYITGLMAVCTLVIPLYNSLSGWQPDAFEESYIFEPDTGLYFQERSMLEENLEKLIYDKLLSEGIKAESVSVNLQISEDNELTDISADIILCKGQSENLQRVRELIGEDLGIKCRAVTDKA